MTELKACLLGCWVALLPVLGLAQSSDFQTRGGVQVNQDLRKGFDVALQYQARLDHQSQAFRGSYVSLDVNYKLGKHWTVFVEGRFATSPSWDKFRGGVGLSGKTKVAKWDLSAKLRYQREHFLQSWPEIGQYPDRNNLRLKLQAEHKVVKHLRGHLSVEPQVRIVDRLATFQRVRNIVGLEWEIVKNHHLDVSYYFQPQFKSLEVKYVNILAATYSLDLDKWKKKGEKKNDADPSSAD